MENLLPFQTSLNSFFDLQLIFVNMTKCLFHERTVEPIQAQAKDQERLLFLVITLINLEVDKKI